MRSAIAERALGDEQGGEDTVALCANLFFFAARAGHIIIGMATVVQIWTSPTRQGGIAAAPALRARGRLPANGPGDGRNNDVGIGLRVFRDRSLAGRIQATWDHGPMGTSVVKVPRRLAIPEAKRLSIGRSLQTDFKLCREPRGVRITLELDDRLGLQGKWEGNSGRSPSGAEIELFLGFKPAAIQPIAATNRSAIAAHAVGRL